MKNVEEAGTDEINKTNYKQNSLCLHCRLLKQSFHLLIMIYIARFAADLQPSDHVHVNKSISRYAINRIEIKSEIDQLIVTKS